jgi:hypothetical protein
LADSSLGKIRYVSGIVQKFQVIIIRRCVWEAFMKSVILSAFAIATVVAFPFTAQAENPAHVRKLLATGACAGCNLAGANLREAHLIGADLRNANLQGANLANANLEGADLTGANLKQANLTGAFATNATFNRANMSNVNLTNARMINAETFGAILDGINIAGAQIYGSGIGVGGEY